MTHVYSAFFLTSSNDRFRVSLSLDTILSSSLSGGGWLSALEVDVTGRLHKLIQKIPEHQRP